MTSDTMKLLLTESQLLHEWQLRFFPENTAADYTLERVDGIDAEAILKARMEDWYRNLLHYGELNLLNPTDISGKCNVTAREDGSGYIVLPEGTLRITGIEMEGWRGAPVITCDLNSRTSRLQKSPYTRGTAESPVAVVSGNRIDLYPAAGKLLTLTAVVDVPGVYALDSAALATIIP